MRFTAVQCTHCDFSGLSLPTPPSGGGKQSPSCIPTPGQLSQARPGCDGWGRSETRTVGSAGQAAGGKKKEGKGSSRNSFGALKNGVIPTIPCEKGNSQYDSDTPTHFPSPISVTIKSQRDYFKAHGPHPMNKVDVSSPLPSIRLMSIDKPQNSPKELGGQLDGKTSWFLRVFVF